MKSSKEPLGSKMTVTKASPTSLELHWQGEIEAYTVTVIDTKTSAVLHSFVTKDRFATLGDLKIGGEYRISVEGSEYVIIEDVIM